MVPVTHSSKHWGFEMKKWIIQKLITVALHVDTRETIEQARILLRISDIADEMTKAMLAPAPAPKKKVGRPLGAKDTRPRKSSKAPA